MRGFARAAIVALSTGFGFARAVDTTTAVLPFDLSHLDFGRELTLLFTLAESSEPCGPSDIQINGQALSTKDGRTGRDTVYEDYGSEIVASWALACTEVDDKPVQESLTVQIDSLDGIAYDDLVFTVTFHQSSPVAILAVDGDLVDFPALDLSSDAEDFWAKHHGSEGAESEVAAAASEIQFLRIQQREIGERIKVLEQFIQDAGGAKSDCHGFRCLVRSIVQKVVGMASKAFEIVLGPSQSHDAHHGNHTDEASPSVKRPAWKPPFCPCSPSSPPTVPAPDPAPESPPAKSLPDIPNPYLPPIDPSIPDIPHPPQPPSPPHYPHDDTHDNHPDDPQDDSDEEHHKTPSPMMKHDTSSFPLVLIFLVLLMTLTAIAVRRLAASIACWRRKRALSRRERRRERHRQHVDAVVSFFRNLIPRPAPIHESTAADMEQQRVPSPPPEEARRTSRAPSNASNTMEQDLAQFRAAVDMVDSMVGAGGEASRRGAGARRSFGESAAYPQDLPPAYQSEDEDAPMLSAVSDGFRHGYGSSGYSPGRGSFSAGNADSLGYAKP